jgi:hypothetical protein
MVRLRRDSTTAIARELARFCHLLTAAARLMYDQKYDPNVWSADPPPIEITGGGGLCGTRSLHSSQATQCNSAVHILLYNRYNSCYVSGWLRIDGCQRVCNCPWEVCSGNRICNVGPMMMAVRKLETGAVYFDWLLPRYQQMLSTSPQTGTGRSQKHRRGIG